MLVRIGDTVKLRDGRVLEVTDAVDQTAPEVILNPDNIFIGRTQSGGTVVTNMDEVVSILN